MWENCSLGGASGRVFSRGPKPKCVLRQVHENRVPTVYLYVVVSEGPGEVEICHFSLFYGLFFCLDGAWEVICVKIV